MQIADGRKTVYQVRVGKAQSMKRLRAKVSSPRGEETSSGRPEENAEASVETAGAAESAATAGATDDADGKARKQPAKKKTAKPKRSASQDQRELEAKQAHINELEAAREHDQDLAEKLRAAEIKIVGLESEIEELKAENAKLREQLEAAQKVTA